MLTRRLVQSSSSLRASSYAIRTISSTSKLQSLSPALSDITPEGVSSFDAKQREFRERIAEQHKRKEASQSSKIPSAPSSSVSNGTPTAPSASNASASSSSNGKILGSLGSSADRVSSSTVDTDGEKRKGKLSSLIYGTKEGREMDRDIEHSFSQVLARGKYVHSIIFHEVKPDKVDEYVELIGSWYPRMAGMPENKVHLVGSWRTEVGDCDTFGISAVTFPLI